jgi:hypothetical protein
MTTARYPIDDTLSSARGAAACLAQIASALTDATTEPAPTPDALRQVAQTIQAQAQRANLGVMSLAAHAGRLEAFAVAQAIEVERQERFVAAARAEVEHEAEKDARLYLEDTAPGREPLDTWAAEAFVGQWEDFWQATLGVDRETVAAWYRVAFERAVKGGAS